MEGRKERRKNVVGERLTKIHGPRDIHDPKVFLSFCQGPSPPRPSPRLEGLLISSTEVSVPPKDFARSSIECVLRLLFIVVHPSIWVRELWSMPLVLHSSVVPFVQFWW